MTSTPSRLVFWLDSPSPHQSSLLRALSSDDFGYDVVGVFEKPIEKERLELGWRAADFGVTRCIIGPETEQIGQFAEYSPESTVHFFGGLQLGIIKKALPIAVASGAGIGLISESRDPRGLIGRLRKLHSYFVERRWRPEIDLVLAIGHRGMHWFEQCGYSARVLFPWGYFVERVQPEGRADSIVDVAEDSSFKVAYVGRFIALKSVDDLIKGLAAHRDTEWKLILIGDGPTRAQHERTAKNRGVDGRCVFTGSVDSGAVRSILGEVDLLVLPSLADGWGAVVNEALMAGVPVVCTDQCGAADLVSSSGHGYVYPAGSILELEKALGERIARGRVSREERASIVEWSHRLDGKAAAAYLHQILLHVFGSGERPSAPWLQP